MGPEDLTMPTLTADDSSNPQGATDPIRVLVQGALAIYLLPVVLLVIAIGAVAIAAEQAAALTARVAGMLPIGRASVSRRRPRAVGRAIGSRPIGSQRRPRPRIKA